MTNPLGIAARLRVATLVALTILTARAAVAQTSTGTIIVRVTADSVPISRAAIVTGRSGTVTDQSGAVIPNASVTVRNRDTGEERQSVRELEFFVLIGFHAFQVTEDLGRQEISPEHTIV